MKELQKLAGDGFYTIDTLEKKIAKNLCKLLGKNLYTVDQLTEKLQALEIDMTGDVLVNQEFTFFSFPAMKNDYCFKEYTNGSNGEKRYQFTRDKYPWVE